MSRSQLKVTYWILRCGKPFKSFRSEVERRATLKTLANQNKRLAKSAYTLKTVIYFSFAL